MVLKVSDTLTGELKVFEPLEEGVVRIYVCGPTVYDLTHIGHARTYIAFDIIVRYLKFKGYKVKYVVNITDVEDKIINKAKELGVTPEEVARKYEKDFFEVIKELNLLPADHYPRVTDHIKDIIEVVKTLIEKGYAYIVDGDVYFDVLKFPDYGKLSKQDLKSLIAGARVEVDTRKKHPADFALWKRAKEGEPYWESPWGPGRPGWHIECTVMSIKYLGEQIDIHGGGSDLIFPHHENEIAQSEAYTGKKPFVKYWLHTGMLQIKGEKMSKSLHNIISVKEFLRKYDGDVLRFLVLSSHYRSPIEFSFEKADQAKQAVNRLRAFMEKLRLESKYHPKEKGDKELEREVLEKLKTMINSFLEAMDNDFHTPKALAVIFEFINYFEKILYKPEIEVGRGILAKVYNELDKLLREVLGFKLTKPDYEKKFYQLVEKMLKLRDKYRAEKNWEIADSLREILTNSGLTVNDTPHGSYWSLI